MHCVTGLHYLIYSNSAKIWLLLPWGCRFSSRNTSTPLSKIFGISIGIVWMKIGIDQYLYPALMHTFLLYENRYLYDCCSVLSSQSYFIVWDCMDVMGVDGSHEKTRVYCNIIIPRHTAKMNTQLPPMRSHSNICCK